MNKVKAILESSVVSNRMTIGSLDRLVNGDLSDIGDAIAAGKTIQFKSDFCFDSDGNNIFKDIYEDCYFDSKAAKYRVKPHELTEEEKEIFDIQSKQLEQVCKRLKPEYEKAVRDKVACENSRYMDRRHDRAYDWRDIFRGNRITHYAMNIDLD